MRLSPVARGSLGRVLVGGMGLNALTLAVTVISGVLVARALSPVGRGELAAILIVPNLAPYVFSFGCQRSAAYRVARHPGEAAAVLSTWAVVLVPVAAVAVVVLELLVPVLLHAQDATTIAYARVWMLTAVLALYNRLTTGVLLGDHDFRAYYLSGFAQPVVITSLYAALWVTGTLTLANALLVNLAGGLAAVGIATVRLLSRHGLARPSARLARELIGYGVRAQGSEVGATVNARLDALLLPSMIAAAPIGLYAIATSVSWTVFALSGALAPVVLPAAARRGARGTRAVIASLHLTLAVALVLGAVAALSAPFLVPLVYGNAFRGAIPSLEILIAGTVLFAAGSVLISGLDAVNHPWRGSMAQLLGAAVTVAGLLVALPLGAGIVGAATVSSGAYALVFVCALVLHRRTTRVPWSAYIPKRSTWLEITGGDDAPHREPARRARRFRPALPREGLAALGAALVAAVAGAGLIALRSHGLTGVQPWTVWWVLLAAALCIVAAGAASTLRGDDRAGARGVGSSIIALGTLVAVSLPAAQLLLGTAGLRLEQYGLHVPDLNSSLTAALAVFLLALLAFWTGERLACLRPSRTATRIPKVDDRLTYGVLVVVGLGEHVLAGSSSGQALFSERGQVQGHGLATVLSWGIPLAISLGIVSRHWGSRLLAATSTGLLLLVVTGGDRSPLFMIGIAAALRLLSNARQSRRPLRAALSIAGLVYLAAVLAIGVSAWRHSVAQGQGGSLPAAVTSAARNPFHSLSERAQLDSLEGLLLSMQVDPKKVGATPLDPAKALVNFVPRQLWPNKPPWLAPAVTHDYLDIGGNAGVFLSGPGYAWIVFGGPLGVLGAFLALGFGTQRIFARSVLASGASVLLAYFCLRFFFGGDSFDLFHVLGLAGLLWIARRAAGLAGGVLGSVRRPVLVIGQEGR